VTACTTGGSQVISLAGPGAVLNMRSDGIANRSRRIRVNCARLQGQDPGQFTCRYYCLLRAARVLVLGGKEGEFWYWVGKKEGEGWQARVSRKIMWLNALSSNGGGAGLNKGGGGGHERATESLRCGIIALGAAVYSSVNLSSAPSP
jgi:hypothetical protein